MAFFSCPFFQYAFLSYPGLCPSRWENVNCFQNVSFQWKSQPMIASSECSSSCELLSKCIFPVEITAVNLNPFTLI